MSRTDGIDAPGSEAGDDAITLRCDYLIVGAGATGMAFADVVLAEGDGSASIVMVDKRPDPGGHWNNASGFVRLHQPACYYGVPSERLEREGDASAFKYEDLSGGGEIRSYYRFLMDKYERGGRVRFYAGCTYDRSADDGTFRSDADGTLYRVEARRRIVDSTYTNVEIPSERPPPFEVDPSVECVPINGLEGMDLSSGKRKRFIVAGAGKTGIDAILYLLNNGVSESDIVWIVSRDAWMFNRDWFNPRTAMLTFPDALTCHKRSFEAYMTEMERIGFYLRIDGGISPSKFSCATVEAHELDQLRSLSNVVRRGRIQAITNSHLIMTKGNPLPFDVDDNVVVNCTANGIPRRPPVPVWQGKKIVLQPVSFCQAAFSAAIIGYVECCPRDKFRTDTDRNNIMRPVPYPVDTRDMIRSSLLSMWNRFEGYGLDSRTKSWCNKCRLLLSSHSSPATTMQLFFGFVLYRQLVAYQKGIEMKMAQHKDEFGVEFELFNSRGPQKSAKLAEAARTVLFVSVALWFVVLALVCIVAYIVFPGRSALSSSIS